MRSGPTLLLATILLCSPGCGADCEQLVADADAARAKWEKCTAGETCVVLQASGGDCTGRFGCPFAVNTEVEEAAVEEAARIADESEGCSECATPECAVALDAYCQIEAESTTGKCVVLRGD